MPTVGMPAPVGGWNARDDLGNMAPEDAVKLVNWRPRPGRCETRGGTSGFLSNPTGSYDGLGTITTFRSTFGDVLVTSAGDAIWADTTLTGSPTRPYAGTTFDGTVFWDSAHFQDKFIMTLGDGTNPAQVLSYDGSTVSATGLNITTGPNEEDIRGVQVHKGRAYYWETAAQSFWYAAAGAYQGDLTEFPLDTAIKSGGALQMMVTLTIDGGGGVDDLAAFIFSSGEVLVYQGDDPGDSAAWELVGSFQIGQPVDPQAHEKLAGTELVFTRDGVIDLSAALQLGRFGESAEFSNKITNAVTKAARDYIANEGWQVVHAPADNCLILNIPTGSGNYRQYIRETDTGSWWECRGWDGRFAVVNDRLHMVIFNGGTPSVVRCFEGNEDQFRSATNEEAVQSLAIPAFSAFRSPSTRKVLTTVKPLTDYGNNNSLKITGLSEFDDTEPSEPSEAINSTASRTAPNVSVRADGHFLSFALQTAERGQRIQWNSTTLTYQNAGSI
jgi:hypothetical protein